jgi:hypothetical protein
MSRVSAFSRRKFASELLQRSPPGTRGRREGRALAAPVARQQQKKLAAVTTGSAETPGLPCAMALRLIPRSPGTGFLAPVARIVRHVARLASTSGGQDHTALPYAIVSVVRAKIARRYERVHHIPPHVSGR